MSDCFRDFLTQVEPVRLKEPLAELLGAFQSEDATLEYRFTEVAKMAGHVCPTVSVAYVCCQQALAKLYPDATLVRGEIAVTVYGEPDDGVYGVMAQVFSFVTGAASQTGFKGLGRELKRKDLLEFANKKPDREAMSFEFPRTDTGCAVWKIGASRFTMLLAQPKVTGWRLASRRRPTPQSQRGDLHVHHQSS